MQRRVKKLEASHLSWPVEERSKRLSRHSIWASTCSSASCYESVHHDICVGVGRLKCIDFLTQFFWFHFSVGIFFCF